MNSVGGLTPSIGIKEDDGSDYVDDERTKGGFGYLEMGCHERAVDATFGIDRPTD